MFLFTQAEYGWTMVEFTLFSAYESAMQCVGKVSTVYLIPQQNVIIEVTFRNVSQHVSANEGPECTRSHNWLVSSYRQNNQQRYNYMYNNFIQFICW